VGGEGGIGVAGEGADAAGVVFGAFFGEELEGSVAGGFEFTVRPVGGGGGLVSFLLLFGGVVCFDRGC